MTLKVMKGRLRKPLGVLLYGVEGIGKTTLASQFPRPIFLDTEGSTVHLDVERVPNPQDQNDAVIRSWTDLQGAMHQLIRDRGGYETVVIDSADWAERLATVALLQSEKPAKASIEDFGFGKGYVKRAESIGRMLILCDELKRAGLNVVWVAHSTLVRVSPPDLTDGFDRWELKLHKLVAPLFKEWADAVLFLTYKHFVVEGDDGRMKGKGGKERIIHAERSAAWDAKNRFGLPDSMPMRIEELAPMFAASAPAKPKGWREQIADAATVAALGEIGDRVDAAESSGRLTAENAATLRQMIDAKHNELEPAAEVA
jgi:hypothetical protein